MYRIGHRLCCLSLAILLIGWGDRLPAQEPAVGVEASRVLKFPSVLGKAYQLEGAADVIGAGVPQWHMLGAVRFGTGGVLTYEIRAADTPPGVTLFRLQEVDTASIGLAPVVLPLGTLSLVQNGTSDQFIFMSATKGVSHPATMPPLTLTWTYVKIGPNTARWQATLGNGQGVLVELQFTRSDGGSYVRTVTSPGGTASDVDAGVFAVTPRQVWHGNGDAKIPTDLVGKKMTVLLSGQPIQLEFGAATVQRKIGNGAGLTVPYVYEPESGVMAVVHVTMGANVEERLMLTAYSATSGTVTRQVYVDGVQKDTQPGTFARPADGPPPNANLNCSAPENVEDHAYDFSSETSGLVTMEYKSNGEGTKSTHDDGSIQQSSFSFSYTKIDDHTGRIVSVFPVLGGTQIDETILHFSSDDNCSGTWERTSSRNGVTIPGSSGSFGPGNPPPP